MKIRLLEKTIANKHKIYSILGLKFKFKLNQQLTIQDLRTHMLSLKFNSGLEKYRGIYRDKSIVIIGGGSSLEYFEKPLDDAIYIGINRAYKIESINFDYLFAQDNFPIKEEIEGFINYKPETCKKFLGIQTSNSPYKIRPTTIARVKNKEFYVLNYRRAHTTFLPLDITVEPFAYFVGTVFAALQFALLTDAKRIYLAGFDCNVSHFFDKDSANWDLAYQYKYWLNFKEYKETLWEENEIISINPVGLKGLFRDVYTKSFINTHLEVNKEVVEII